MYYFPKQIVYVLIIKVLIKKGGHLCVSGSSRIQIGGVLWTAILKWGRGGDVLMHALPPPQLRLPGPFLRRTPLWLKFGVVRLVLTELHNENNAWSLPDVPPYHRVMTDLLGFQSLLEILLFLLNILQLLFQHGFVVFSIGKFISQLLTLLVQVVQLLH